MFLFDCFVLKHFQSSLHVLDIWQGSYLAKENILDEGKKHLASDTLVKLIVSEVSYIWNLSTAFLMSDIKIDSKLGLPMYLLCSCIHVVIYGG